MEIDSSKEPVSDLYLHAREKSDGSVNTRTVGSNTRFSSGEISGVIVFVPLGKALGFFGRRVVVRYARRAVRRDANAMNERSITTRVSLTDSATVSRVGSQTARREAKSRNGQNSVVFLQIFGHFLAKK